MKNIRDGLVDIVLVTLGIALGANGCAIDDSSSKRTVNYVNLVNHNYYSKNDAGYHSNIDRRTFYEQALKEAKSFYDTIDINEISRDEKKDLEVVKENIQTHPISDNERKLLKDMGLNPDKLKEKDLYFLDKMYSAMVYLISGSGASVQEDERIGITLFKFFLEYGKL